MKLPVIDFLYCLCPNEVTCTAVRHIKPYQSVRGTNSSANVRLCPCDQRGLLKVQASTPVAETLLPTNTLIAVLFLSGQRWTSPITGMERRFHTLLILQIVSKRVCNGGVGVFAHLLTITVISGTQFQENFIMRGSVDHACPLSIIRSNVATATRRFSRYDKIELEVVEVTWDHLGTVRINVSLTLWTPPRSHWRTSKG